MELCRIAGRMAARNSFCPSTEDLSSRTSDHNCLLLIAFYAPKKIVIFKEDKTYLVFLSSFRHYFRMSALPNHSMFLLHQHINCVCLGTQLAVFDKPIQLSLFVIFDDRTTRLQVRSVISDTTINTFLKNTHNVRVNDFIQSILLLRLILTTLKYDKNNFLF